MEDRADTPETLDHAAMQRLRDGDDLALNDIMQRWKQPLVSHLYRQLNNQQDAVDLAQETFVRVYQQRHHYQPHAKFSTWLFTIATHLSLNHVRWRKRHPALPLDAPASPDETTAPLQPTDPGPNPRESLVADEQSRLVQDAIRSLPEEMKTAVLLYAYEDQSYDDIARILKCTRKAVEARLYRARHQLRAFLHLKSDT